MLKIIFWICIFNVNFLFAKERAIYLTLMHDPATSMMVHWVREDALGVPEIEYRVRGASQWLFKESSYGQIAGRTHKYTVELIDLQPDTVYEFRIVGSEGLHQFRTLPLTLSRVVGIVIGGDAFGSLQMYRQMNAQVASLSPDFVVIGGDIAYANGTINMWQERKYALNRWLTFFEEWQRSMVTPEGRMIPLVPVVGNHDVRKSSTVFYKEFFGFQPEETSYFSLDVGNYLSLFLLDTGHILPIAGPQTEWLTQTLASREDRLYTMAVYHVGAYPSYYSYNGSVPVELRSKWVPLFERYHLQAAFEHHSHAYKRTYPLKGGVVNPDGVLYLGDGSWGVPARKPKGAWYLEKAEQKNAVFSLCFSQDSCEITAIDPKGNQIDHLTIQPHITHKKMILSGAVPSVTVTENNMFKD